MLAINTPTYKFTIEIEKQNKLFLLDVQIICEDKTLTTSVYHKPTFSGVHTHFDNFVPSNYKFCIAYTLAYRCFSICSSWTKLHSELLFLEYIFLIKKNGYSQSFIKAIDNIHVVKEPTLTLEKKPLV